MKDPSKQNKRVNKTIAENEAKRSLMSEVRVSSWAIVLAIVVALGILVLYSSK